MRYRILEDIGGRRKFVVVLDAGEEVIATVTAFATELKVEGASLSGVGALSRSALGHFDPATKKFTRNDIDEQTEVLSILGNIAVGDDGAVKLHIHIALGCQDASVYGGHLVEGWVSPTMELIVEESETHLRRGVDAETGLVLLEPRKAAS